MRRLPRLVAAAALVALGLALVAPIAREGTAIGHDSRHHLVWAAQFAASLEAGIPYPRWLPDVNQGLGNPTFVFYPPLLYYAAAALLPLAGSAPRALDLAAALALVASGAAAYRYLRGGLGRRASLLGALALMALPYRLLNLYERAAVAEFAAFLWPPAGLLALRALARAPDLPRAGAAASGLAFVTAGLALTHLPTLVLWGPLLALAALWPRPRAEVVARAWSALALGLGAAAVFLLPAYVERPFVQLEWLDWVARAEFHTLFSTDMPHGSQMMAFNHKVSRLACWTAALAAGAAAAALWPGGGRPWLDAASRPRLPVGGAAVLAAVAFVLMLGWSSPVWASVPVLSAIQFPWRLLAMLSPAAALLVACGSARVPRAEAPLAARALGVVAVGLLAANLVVAWRDVVARAHHDPGWAARLSGDPRAAQDAAEYRPRWAPAAGFPRLPRAEALVPGGRAAVRAWSPEQRLLEVEVAAPGRVRVATFFYPGWRAAVDGRPAAVRLGPSGVIEVEVPAGRHMLELWFDSTWDRRAGAVVSGGSLLVLVGWAAWGWLRTVRRKAVTTPRGDL